ncbi:hypothetical protein [Kitasatospora humi]|nr:hypothetical protein [Kitasatospora humi]
MSGSAGQVVQAQNIQRLHFHPAPSPTRRSEPVPRPSGLSTSRWS